MDTTSISTKMDIIEILSSETITSPDIITSSTSYKIGNDNKLAELTKTVTTFQRIAIVFGLFILFMLCVGIGCFCLIKCKRTKKGLRQLISGQPLHNSNRDPIFTGSRELINMHTHRLEELRQEEQKRLNFKKKITGKPDISHVQMEGGNFNQNEGRSKIEIGYPVLESTSVINENYRPNNFYEKEHAE